ncbi:hypothetical protein ACIQUW_32910 [Streptomyces sp. NPDC101117]|uniref:hypothetical protein n=1 Tax=Streptomyces sp. NPDC101117 TaxID=3366108 RepID=UPI00380B719E
MTTPSVGRPLTETERTMLRYALDQAQEQMLCVGDEFSEDDHDAIDSLRRLADEAQQQEPESGCAHCGGDHSWDDCQAYTTVVADEAQQQDPDETEAHPPYHRWYTETRDDLAEEWAPGMRFTDRAEALARFETVSRNHPLWKDGTPVRRRFVRETTSYTVEQPDAAPRPEPPVHGESVAHLAGLHDAEPTVDARQDGACPPGCIACATDESHDPTWARQDGAQS